MRKTSKEKTSEFTIISIFGTNKEIHQTFGLTTLPITTLPSCLSNSKCIILAWCFKLVVIIQPKEDDIKYNTILSQSNEET